MKFEKPRKTTRGNGVENMYAKFGVPTKIRIWSKIGGTKASGEREPEEEEEDGEE